MVTVSNGSGFKIAKILKDQTLGRQGKQDWEENMPHKDHPGGQAWACVGDDSVKGNWKGPGSRIFLRSC
jgi:hypothetical protein